MKRLSFCTISLSLVLAAPLARAQSMPLPNVVISEGKDADVKLPDFDVASVKQNKGDSGMMRWMYTSDGISLTNLSLKNVIASAYDVKQFLISGGPSWVNNISFDLDAKVAASDVETFKKLSPAQRRLMLQKLLAERFNLAVHFETKTLPVYDLVIATGGPKFKPAAPDPPAPSPDADPSDHPKPRGGLSMGKGMLKLQDMPFSSFVSQLGYAVDREVIDKTGLVGKYNIDLKWTPDDRPGSESGLTDQDAEPHLFTALQEQLGLKLESAKGPVQTLIIDRAEMPSAN
jgi:uncharacterized protein (TIGR03435 family)